MINKSVATKLGGCFGASLVLAVPLMAWLTHIIHTIRAEEWLFLLAGAIFAPIGIVHGIGLWLGAW